MGAQQRAVITLIHEQQIVFAEAGFFEQLGRPEVQPIAGIERDRHAVASMQRRTTPTHRTTVLDIVDDERAGVNQFDRFGARPATRRCRQRQRQIAIEKPIAERNQLCTDALPGVCSQVGHGTEQHVHKNISNRRSGVKAKQLPQAMVIGKSVRKTILAAALLALLKRFVTRRNRHTGALEDRILHASLLGTGSKSLSLASNASGVTARALARRTSISIERFCLPPSTATMQTRVTRVASDNCSWVQPFFVRSSRTRRAKTNKYSFSTAFGRSARSSLPISSMPSVASRAMTQPRWRLTGKGLAAKSWPPRTTFGAGDSAANSSSRRCTWVMPCSIVTDSATKCAL